MNHPSHRPVVVLMPGEAMPPKGSKRPSAGGGGNAKSKAKTGLPADAQKMPHMVCFDDWMLLDLLNWIST